MASGKKKRKNTITLLSLAAALAVLLAAYLGVSKWKGGQEADEGEPAEDTDITLAAFDTETIGSITVESDRYSYSLCSRESGWEMAGDVEFPLDTARADKMAVALKEFSATRLVVQNSPDLSEYGLSEPVLKVAVAKADGTATLICIGDQSSVDGGYYACIGGSSDVYLVPATNRNVFYLEEEKLMLLDSVPSFDSNYATGLKVSSDIYPEFTVAASPEDEYDLTARGLYPYSLYGVYVLPVHVDLTNFASLMEDYASIDLGDFTSYKGAELGNYGLDAPNTALTVWYTDSTGEEKGDFTIYFGDLAEDGTKRYVRLEGSNQVFAMAEETAEALLAVDTFRIISKYPQMVNITILGGLRTAYGDTKREFGLRHVAESTDGSTSTKDFFTVDGKELDGEEEEEAFRDIYQVLIALKLTGALGQELEVGKEPVLSLEFLEDGTMENLLTVKYLPITGDSASYAIEVNGVRAFTADATAVEEAITALREYQP